MLLKKIHINILGGYVFLALVMFAIGCIAYIGSQKIADASERLYGNSLIKNQLVQDFKKSQHLIQILTQQHLWAKNDAERKIIEETIDAEYKKNTERIAEFYLHEGEVEEKILMDSLLVKRENYRKKREQLIQLSYTNRDSAIAFNQKEQLPAYLAFSNTFDTLSNNIFHQTNEAAKHTSDFIITAQPIINSLLISALLGLVIIGRIVWLSEKRLQLNIRALSISDTFNRGVLDSLSSHVAVINGAGIIVSVNAAWRNFAKANGATKLLNVEEGSNYFEVCEKAALSGDTVAGEALRGIQEVLAGKKKIFYLEYPCHSREEKRWFAMRVMKFVSNEPMVVVSHQNITEKRKAEKELAEKENYLRTIFESEPECIKLIDQDGKILEMNPRGLAMLEAESLEQVKGKSIFPFINDPYRNGFIQLTNNVLREESGELQFILTGLKGGQRWLETHAVPFKDTDGKAIALLGITRDITEKRKATAERDELLNVLQNSLNEIYIFNSETLNFEYVNEAALSNLGYSQIEMTRLTPIHIKPEYTLQKFRDLIAPLVSNEKRKIIFETIHKRKDGSTYPVEVHLQFVAKEKKRVFLAIILDISERIDAEAKLISSKENFRALYEENPLMNFTLNAEGKILSVNRCGATDLGYRKDELTGNSILHVFYPEDHHAVLNQIKECISNPKTPFSWEIRKLTKEGKTIWVSETATALPDENEKYLVLIICENITNRKKAEREIVLMNEELRKLSTHLENVREEERTRIAREIHDELGQQLTGIKMDLSIINNKIPSTLIGSSESILKVIEMIDTSLKTVHRISSDLRPSILDDLGLLAAMEVHCLEFEKRFGIACDCNSTIEELSFEKTFSTGVFRIFQESLTNIARHSKATNIKCRLKQEGNQLVLSVKDNGTGFTIDSSKEKSLGIMGMKERAAMLGGNLTIESIEGKGTHIKLNAPIRLLHNV